MNYSAAVVTSHFYIARPCVYPLFLLSFFLDKSHLIFGQGLGSSPFPYCCIVLDVFT